MDFSQVIDLSHDISGLPATVLPLVRVAVEKTSADIQRDAQIIVPVDTGHLKGSITHETRSTSDGAEGTIGPTAAYGDFVERGTSRMAPQPYMGPAADRNAPAFGDAIATIVGRTP
jgi:HK97 gp10 family phage protein